jgi:hypothetical protein
MPRPSPFIGLARNTEKLILVAAMVFTGCSFDPSVLKGYSESDSSVAMDGSATDTVVASLSDSPLGIFADSASDLHDEGAGGSATDAGQTAEVPAVSDTGSNEPSSVADVVPDLPATSASTATNTQTQTTATTSTWTVTTTTTITVTSTATSVTTYEAETLATTSSAVGYNVANDGGASGGQYVQLSGTPTVGDYLEFTLPSVAAGTYAVDLYYRGFTIRGINQASIDGANIGTTTDEYSTTYVNQVLKTLGSTTLDSGSHTIRFTITGKGSGSAYAMTVDKIVFTLLSSTSTGTSTTTTTATGTK